MILRFMRDVPMTFGSREMSGAVPESFARTPRAVILFSPKLHSIRENDLTPVRCKASAAAQECNRNRMMEEACPRVRGGDDTELAEHPQWPTIEKGANVLDHSGEERPIVLRGDIAQMRCQHDIVERSERVVDRQRLYFEDVETRAGDSFLTQRRKQCGFFDDRAARGVDQKCGRLHQPEFARADQSACAFRQL